MVVISRDEVIMRMASEAVSAPWIVEQFGDQHDGWRALVRPGVKLVVIDDLGIDESARGWLLGQARRHAPDAMVVYIASSHSIETERNARAHQVQFYTSRPIDGDCIRRVLASFANAANRAAGSAAL